MDISTGKPEISNAVPDAEKWADALIFAAKTLGLKPSPERVRLAGRSSTKFSNETISLMTQAAGMIGTFVDSSLSQVTNCLVPIIALSTARHMVLIRSVNDDEMEIIILLGESSVAKRVPVAELETQLKGPMLSVGMVERAYNHRIEDYLSSKGTSWFSGIFLGNCGLLFQLVIGSFVSSIIALAISLFSMQVWDRVVPARSLPTLWVLVSGVILALIFDFIIRTLKTSITDHFGKKADLKLSAFFFAHALDVRNDARPRSPGTLIAQLRDIDQIRELFTSTTFGAAMDTPFVATFIGIIWVLGGEIVLVPLAAIPFIIMPILVTQIPLSKLASEGLAEATLRNAILMESIYRIEDIKTLQAEQRFRRLWIETNRVNATIGMRQRSLASLLMNWTQTVQQLAYVGVVVFGVYKILDNSLSFGALLACSILTSRALAPLAQISAIFSRLQNGLVGRKGLNNLLSLPVDHERDKTTYHRATILGSYRFRNVIFNYGQEQRPALAVMHLNIQPGEKIAILGRVGAGKSTLLRLAGGLALPTLGQIELDGTDITLIDIADIRRDVGFTSQQSGLFYGTVRENLLIANPVASDEKIEEALRISCADQLVLGQSHGLDLQLRENGIGLSEGQRQSLILARAILRSPKILLLDEPTASLDETTERAFIKNLKGWSATKTVIVATHRYPVLDLVDRIIVVDKGLVVLDGPKDDVLMKLSAAEPSAENVQRK